MGNKEKMKVPKGQKLVDSYKKNYNIATDVEVTEEMILAHWDLERRLTNELLESTPENRWKKFDRCYTVLYSEIWWLNRLVDTDNTISQSQRFKNWVHLISQSAKNIYEIGSGKADMITYLAHRGFNCRATEITRERGQKYVSENPNLSWNITDGVHLERFEAPNTYDTVISVQVIEHLHPDDLYDHFKGVISILSNDGKYIFTTPHKYFGPSDISKVFGYDEPVGMHLREYTYKELKELLKRAGFKDISAVLAIPPRITQSLRIHIKPKVSRTYLTYLCIIEKLISCLPNQKFRRKAASLLIFILFSPNIFIKAHKE